MTSAVVAAPEATMVPVVDFGRSFCNLLNIGSFIRQGPYDGKLGPHHGKHGPIIGADFIAPCAVRRETE